MKDPVYATPAPYWTPKSAGNQRAAVDAIMARAEKEKVRCVNLQFTDLMGIVKSVAIPLHQFEDACLSGKWFDGSSIEGFARIAESDMYLKPDIRTYKVIPWEREQNTTARVICQVFTPDGKIVSTVETTNGVTPVTNVEKALEVVQQLSTKKKS